MRDRRGWLPAVAAMALCTVVAGCIEVARVRIFNNLDGPLVIQLKSDSGDDEGATLAHGEWKEFSGPNLGDYVLRLTYRRCDYLYNLPEPTKIELPRNLRWGLTYYPLKLQVQPDFSIHMMHQRARRPMPSKDLNAIKIEGFPLKPVSKTCG